MIVENNNEIAATCHLTIIPSLTFQGAARLNIEAVRVKEKFRGQAIGQWMIGQVINYGRDRGATIVQLATNKKRSDAKRFYEKLGFVASHDGMKLCL
jgi:GNAT superfamily N-acetyltransferase